MVLEQFGVTLARLCRCFGWRNDGQPMASVLGDGECALFDERAFLDLIEPFVQFSFRLLARAAHCQELGAPPAGGRIGAEVELEPPGRLAATSDVTAHRGVSTLSRICSSVAWPQGQEVF